MIFHVIKFRTECVNSKANEKFPKEMPGNWTLKWLALTPFCHVYFTAASIFLIIYLLLFEI